MSFFGEHYRLYVPPSISGYEKVKITTMNQTNTMEMEPLTKGIVIFGATGDLCKKKLIPALYKLWQKELLPENFLILGCARSCLLYTSPSPRDQRGSRMPSSA